MAKPRLNQSPNYERGFIDGMKHQMQSSVDKAVNAMAKPKQEPVGWYDKHEMVKHNPLESVTSFTPPPRPWVGLTKEEAKEISLANRPYVIDMIAALEAKLKEKNDG